MRLIQVGSFNYEMASVSNNGIIVYSSNKIDNKNLLFYKKLNSETSPVMIGEGSLPKISPQGDKIIYSKGDSSIFVYEIKNNTTIDLTSKIQMSGTQSPAWDADGKNILFSAGKFPDIGLYRYNMETERIATLLDVSGLNYGVSASPDGSKIAFRSARGKTKEEMKKGIVVYDLNTKTEKFITTIGEYCTWSPDSKQLAFHWPDSSDFCIYTVNADGSDLRKIAKVKDSDCELPSWSTDGNKLYFQTNRRNGNWEIWIMNKEGTDQQPLVWHD